MVTKIQKQWMGLEPFSALVFLSPLPLTQKQKLRVEQGIRYKKQYLHRCWLRITYKPNIIWVIAERDLTGLASITFIEQNVYNSSYGVTCCQFASSQFCDELHPQGFDYMSHEYDSCHNILWCYFSKGGNESGNLGIQLDISSCVCSANYSTRGIPGELVPTDDITEFK